MERGRRDGMAICIDDNTIRRQKPYESVKLETFELPDTMFIHAFTHPSYFFFSLSKRKCCIRGKNHFCLQDSLKTIWFNACF
jgi:hypothetical protein